MHTIISHTSHAYSFFLLLFSSLLLVILPAIHNRLSTTCYWPGLTSTSVPGEVDGGKGVEPGRRGRRGEVGCVSPRVNARALPVWKVRKPTAGEMSFGHVQVGITSRLEVAE